MFVNLFRVSFRIGVIVFLNGIIVDLRDVVLDMIGIKKDLLIFIEFYYDGFNRIFNDK